MTTLAQVLVEALESRLADIHVALPARIEAYDAATQTADCKPLIKRALRLSETEELVESLPVVPGVPVLFPRAGDWFLSLPLKKGDTVLLVFCERSLDQWLEKGDEVDAGDLRLHGLDGAVAIPGVYSSKDKLANVHEKKIVLGRNGGAQIHIRDDDTVALGEESPSDWVAIAADVNTELDKLKDDINDL